MTDCNHNIDPLKLIREGTSQDQRPFEALDPAYAPVNEMTPAHSMVFAQAYAAYLRYVDAADVPVDDWKRFFGNDVSVLLSIAAVQDVEYYKMRVLELFRYLNDHNNKSAQDLDKYLGYLFAYAGTMAQQLDLLKESLPPELGLKSTLQNLIKNQLSAGFGRLISYHKGGKGINPGLIDETNLTLDFKILGSSIISFNDVVTTGLSTDWQNGATNWAAYIAGMISNTTSNESVYGDLTSLTTDFDRINHAITHNLFTSVFDQLLKVYARTVAEAKKSLEGTFTNWDSHEPHYTLFLAFLRLFEYARTEMNTLTGRHLDFYYRDILKLKEKSAQPGHAHLLVELAKHAPNHELNDETLFKAGKDALGKDAFFVNDRDFVANQAKVAALKTIYRHDGELVDGNNLNVWRLYASPIANSEDGSGAELINADKSWHPFFNKRHDDGILRQINMPMAEVGFAIASHCFLMTEGERLITLSFKSKQQFNMLDRKVVCLLSTEKGWLVIKPNTTVSNNRLDIQISGANPAIVPYKSKIHGYEFNTDLPVLIIKMLHDESFTFFYGALEDIMLSGIELMVQVRGLKTLSVSNDFGPVDTSKPFQPFGPSPVKDSSVTVGSKEVFQKKIISASLHIKWQTPPAPFTGSTARIADAYLHNGNWESSDSSNTIHGDINTTLLSIADRNSTLDLPDFSENEIYETSSRHGFIRLSLTDDFGQSEYQTALLQYLTKNPTGSLYPGNPPQGPVAAAITMDYAAIQTITLNTTIFNEFKNRPAKFFHIFAFGYAERHSYLEQGNVIFLMPQFHHNSEGNFVKHEAEFYIGITGLKPPQNLALLFQVANGTADPLSQKPKPHLHWSYLHANSWKTFDKDAVEDQTGELTRSGIVTLAMPREISDNNTLLPTGMHWIRIAVEKESDTVCRLISVAAQALRATFTNQGNDTTFSSTPLEAGTIAKLDQPDSAVKKIIQPFATFGGRGQEAPNAYYTRVSERLRHKERAIALWDYERLVLEAFPQIYKVKCLNHTHYEPNENGDGIYRELAAGHVTIVTIPNQKFQNLRDPLRPYTSLGLLLEIEAFLKQRLSCFARLHVKNPQFEEVRVDFRVRFHAGFDETYYTNQLKREITRFLSPWAFPGGGSPSFGGKIYKSVLINFIEERPFVDFITDFKLFHTIGGKHGTVDFNEVEGSTAVSILVSVPEEKHGITAITIAAEPLQTAGDPCPCQT